MKSKPAQLPGILFLTSYPPRECGIATFSQNLIDVLNRKFSKSFSIKICALETTHEKYQYPPEVVATLDTDIAEEYTVLAQKINQDDSINAVVIQHEFGFFHKNEKAFEQFLFSLLKPVSIVFHTVLPRPEHEMKLKIEKLVSACEGVVVMTNHSQKLLVDYYDIPRQKITVIPHGTHLVKHLNKAGLKKEYGFSGRIILSTFGLLNAGKSIETTLDALPSIIPNHPEVLFLIIGKTHPVVVENEGERYREMLQQKVMDLKLENNVRFINSYLDLPDLMRYLQLTDIYLFTSKDPHQAVSGTFAYAMSCACAIVSTPIPHAREVINSENGFLFDFGDALQLSERVNHLLEDNSLRQNISINALQKIIPTAWENVAIAYAHLLTRKTAGKIKYNLPALNLYHIKQMTKEMGIIQFAKGNQPDKSTGYTIDDNARALIALCKHYEVTGDKEDLPLLDIYLEFLKYCQQPGGNFLNYVDYYGNFTEQNKVTNLEDSNGRTIWALGYFISKKNILSEKRVAEAEKLLENAIPYISALQSPRAMSFAIKGFYYYNKIKKLPAITALIDTLAARLLRLYNGEAGKGWAWFEPYLTYANSVLPEAVLCAYQETGNPLYKAVAATSFDFLLEQTFNEEGIKVISNKSWLYKGEEAATYGEQPIDVAYTILALGRFYDEFKNPDYLLKMKSAFNWFLGNNHLRQIIYNPCTGGCYDGLEETQVNLNQGAESTISYLMARLTIGKDRDVLPFPNVRKPVRRGIPYPKMKLLNPGHKFLK
jgi:glycosyltransferase involved in cell wall biosynthesis